MGHPSSQQVSMGQSELRTIGTQPEAPKAVTRLVAESDATLIAKRNNKLNDVPTATAPPIKSMRDNYGPTNEDYIHFRSMLQCVGKL